MRTPGCGEYLESPGRICSVPVWHDLWIIQSLGWTSARNSTGGCREAGSPDHDPGRKQPLAPSLSIPKARRGGLALAGGRHLPRPDGWAVDGSPHSTLPEPLHDGRTLSLRSIPRPIPRRKKGCCLKDASSPGLCGPNADYVASAVQSQPQISWDSVQSGWWRDSRRARIFREDGSQ